MSNIKLSELNSATLIELNQSEAGAVVGGRRGWTRNWTRTRIRGIGYFRAYKSFNTQQANNISIIIQLGDNNIANVYQSAVNIIN